MANLLKRNVSVYINGTQVKSTIGDLKKELAKLEAQQKTLTIGTDEYIKTSLKIKELKSILEEQKRAVSATAESFDKASQKAANFSSILIGMRNAFQMIRNLSGTVQQFGEEAAHLDDVYSTVMKTTGLTHDQVAELNEEFKKMDTRTSREQLNLLAYQAGKLGFSSKEAVQQFVEAADVINVALGDVLGEDATLEIAKLADVYSQSTRTIEDQDLKGKMIAVGSAINQLGKESTASESYMVDFLGRLGGVATQAGISADQILGYASALDQQKQKVEMAATAFQKLIQQMIKKPEEFVEQARMPLDEFRQLMDTDMNAAVLRVLEGFNEMGGLTALVPVFKDMGLDGARAASVVASLAANLDKVSAAQATASEHIQLGTSMTKEYNTMNASLEAQLEKAKKKMVDAREELGNQLYPVMVKLVNAGGNLTGGISGFISLLRQQPALIAPVATALVALNKARLLNIANSIKQRLETAKKNIVQAAEHRQTLRNEAATARQAAQTEKARLEQVKLRLEETKKIATDRAYCYTLDGMNARAKAQTDAVKLQRIATAQAELADRAHTRAIQAKRAAFAAMPWGMIITALTAIGTAVYSIWRNSERVKLQKVMREVAHEAGEAQGKVKVLFDRLKEAAAGSEEYRKALEELKAEYPDLIAKHIDEAGKVRDLSQAYEELSAAARQSVYDRMYAEKAASAQGELSSNLEDRIKKTSRQIDRAFRSLSEAERTAIKQQYNTLLREAAEGNTAMADILIRANKLIENNGGDKLGARARVLKNELMKMRGEAQLTQKSLDDLKTNLKPTDQDPFGVQRMSLEQLNQELADSQRRLASWQRAASSGRDGYADRIDSETKKIEALRSQIAKLQADQKKDAAPTVQGDSPAGDQTDPKEAARRAKAAAKEWQKASDAAQKLIGQLNLRAESGLQKLQDEVEQKTAATLSRLKEAAAAAGEDSSEMERQIREAADRLRQSKIDSYIAKIRDAYDTLADSLDDRDAAGRMAAESEKLTTALASIDEALSKAEADAANATGEHRRELDRLIRSYRDLKAEIQTELLDRLADDEEGAAVVKQARTMAREATKGIEQQIANIQLDRTPFQRWCDDNLDTIETFANKALSIFSDINTLLQNIGDSRLQDLEDEKDAAISTLDEQLEQGLISEEAYNERKQQLEDEYTEKENEEKEKQWEREKAYSIAEATINAALAAIKVWSGEGTTLTKAAMSAMLASELALQIAAIKNQPKPYARGGYVDKDTVFRAGERGREWVASNRLVNDPVTAPIIQQLENYQRGRTPQFARPDYNAAMGAAAGLAAARTAPAATATATSDSREMLAAVRELSSYLRDPRNRQAVISRRTMQDFDRQEQFLRNAARL